MAKETTDQTASEEVQEPEPVEMLEDPPPQTEPPDEEAYDPYEDVTEEAEEAALPPEDPMETLEKDLERTKAEADKNRTDYLRALADMENLRKRTGREKENARKFAVEKFASDLLGAMDNVQRAMDAMDAGVETDQEGGASLQSVIEGVRMIQSEFENVFAKNGITRIETANTSFDPNVHEAVQQVAAEDVKPGTVIQEMRAGYLLNERLLRPAMVSVSK